MTKNGIRCLDPARVGAVIEWALEDWPGNCSDIALRLIQYEIVEGTHRYGHYRGPVSKKSLFHKRQVVQHGWVELADGSVCDPLRWEFEGFAPYIFVDDDEFSHEEEYDVGGNVFRMAMMSDCPAVDKAKAKIPLPKGEVVWFVLAQLPHGPEQCIQKVDWNVAHWFANQAPQQLGEYARPIYEWLVANKLGALIPLDNRKLVLGERTD